MSRIPTARELYPDLDSCGEFWAPEDYSPICRAFGEIIRKDDIGEYQGDTQILYFDCETGRYGYMTYGWGSCSMCDRLQGCRSYDEIDVLVENLRSSVRWFDDDNDALGFFEGHDWKGDWGYSEDFVQFCVEFFRNRIEMAGGVNEDKK